MPIGPLAVDLTVLPGPVHARLSARAEFAEGDFGELHLATCDHVVAEPFTATWFEVCDRIDNCCFEGFGPLPSGFARLAAVTRTSFLSSESHLRNCHAALDSSLVLDPLCQPLAEQVRTWLAELWEASESWRRGPDSLEALEVAATATQVARSAGRDDFFRNPALFLTGTDAMPARVSTLDPRSAWVALAHLLRPAPAGQVLVAGDARFVRALAYWSPVLMGALEVRMTSEATAVLPATLLPLLEASQGHGRGETGTWALLDQDDAPDVLETAQRLLLDGSGLTAAKALEVARAL